MAEADKTEHHAGPPAALGVYGWFIWILKDAGPATFLIAFVCYLLAVQFPDMRSDFRTQTDKLVDAVSNNSKVIGDNNRVMFELSNEIRQMRQERNHKKGP